MKKLLAILPALFCLSVTAQNIGMGTNVPSASALLDVTATNKGVLVPRLTNAQMIAIASPANGLLVYNTDSACFAYRNATVWVFLKGNTTASSDWSTKGNAGTDTGKNFIGTIDDMDVIFKRNNEQAGWLNESLKNTSLGAGSLNATTTGFNNTANGYRALKNNSIGYSNTAIGGQALGSNNIGSRNTAAGFAALYSNISGNENAANGTQALLNNIGGSSNTSSGFQSLFSNGSGFSNVAVGAKALYSNTNRSNLVAIGDSALYNNSTGEANTAMGSKALYSNNTGGSNTAVGFESLKSNTSGRRNTATGWLSMQASNSSFGNSAFGYSALAVNNGILNVAIGAGAFQNNSTGDENTVIGTDVLNENISGSNNTALGNAAGYQNKGSANVFLGYRAGQNEIGSNKLYISNDQTNADNTLVYGEFDNKILSIGGKLGIGTITPQNLLHLKDANTDNNASQLIIEGNSNYGDATTAAIEFRSNFSSGNADPSGRIKSYYTSNNYTDAQTVFQTIAPGPVFVDAMVLSNGNVNVPNGSVSTGGNLSATGNLFAGGRAGIGISPTTFPLAIKGTNVLNDLIKLYNDAGVAKWHLKLLGNGSLNFTETGVADNRLVLGVGGEAGIGKVPLTTDDDSRLQVKQKGSQNGFGVEAGNSTNHWDFYATSDVANTKLNMYYNGAFKGAYDNVTGAYTAASDRRLKKDITPQQPVLNNVLQLKAYQYHYLDNQPTDRFSNGFMAQDVQKFFPDAVVENVMKDGETRLGINYQYFTVLAIKGLQEQQQQIQSQEERIAKLEALVKTLTERK